MTIDLRPANEVMRLDRLGSFHECRLSFMRVMLRRIRSENWSFRTPDWQFGSDGTGYAVYTVDTPNRAYSLVAFEHDLPDDQRSDRVIAEAWDTTFALFDGIPSKQDIERLAANVPLQERGRISSCEITMSRANRSTRAWSHTVNALAEGQQPDAEFLAGIGYLMRTTAVYGSGKFGAVDYDQICDRPEFSSAFQAEMLTVFLVRQFVFDLIEHHARLKTPKAARLSDDIKRQLGIGNSTGLGMAPFLVNHPELLHNWIEAREVALARVRSVETATKAEIDLFNSKLETAIQRAQNWSVDDTDQMNRIDELRQDLAQTKKWIFAERPASFPWDKLINWSTCLGLEAQEQLVSLVLEPYGHLVDDLAMRMKRVGRKTAKIDGTQTVGELSTAISQQFDWALRCDYVQKEDLARFWYVSEEKLEPRLGERFEERGAELERPMGIGRDICDLLNALESEPQETRMAQFLLKHSKFRRTVQRIEIAARCQYSEIQDNLLCAQMRPIDMLRCKLAFFGATRFDPRSDRWVRICMFQGAPLIADFEQAKPLGQTG